jgi:hypothetical protein
VRYIKNRRNHPRPPQKRNREVVYLHTRINGEHKIAISRRLLEEVKDMPHVRKVDHICARTGLGYAEINGALNQQK